MTKEWVPYSEYHDIEPVSCERCGAPNLHWLTDWKGKPVLCEDLGNLHECPPSDADEFEIVETPK